MLKFFLKISHGIKRTVKMLNKRYIEKIFKKTRQKNVFFFILSIYYVLISILIFGSFAVESTNVVADDDANGDDDKPL